MQHFFLPCPLEITAHQVEEKKCPCCGGMNRASFPENIKGPMQYGERVQALSACHPLARSGANRLDLAEMFLHRSVSQVFVLRTDQRSLEPTSYQAERPLDQRS